MIYQSDKAHERVFDADFYTVFSDAGFKQQPREALRIKDMISWYNRNYAWETYKNNSTWGIYHGKN